MQSLRWLSVVFAIALPSLAIADDDDARDDDSSGMMKNKAATQVQSHVVPAIAGIESADKLTAVLYELASNPQQRQKDAQMTIDLAQRALGMALDRAEALDDIAGLSNDAKEQAEQAAMKLREARVMMRSIDKQVGGKKLTPKQSEIVRSQAKELHDDLSAAEESMERIAKAYDVPTELEFRG